MVAHFFLGWPWRPRSLAGVALSTTSVAVVYAVMLELGFNQTTYGKAILVALSLVLFLILPFVTRCFFERYANIRFVDSVLFHSRRKLCIGAGAGGGSPCICGAILRQSVLETGRPLTDRSGFRLQRP